MVRHKTRWLLVRIEFEDCIHRPEVKSSHENDSIDFPSRKELAKEIRNSVSACGGVAASGAAFDTQGKRRVPTVGVQINRIEPTVTCLVQCTLFRY